ncbi:MAG: hypothetical protein R2706_14760 [Acidimicrobiales bacterium]
MDHSSIHEAADEGDLDLRPMATIDGTDPILPSRFPIGQIAAVALAGLGSAAADLAESAGGSPEQFRHRSSRERGSRLASPCSEWMVSRSHAQISQIPLSTVTRRRMSGVVYLHGGFPRLRQGLADLLGIGTDATFPQVQAAVKFVERLDLEDGIAERNLCGAMVRSHDE